MHSSVKTCFIIMIILIRLKTCRSLNNISFLSLILFSICKRILYMFHSFYMAVPFCLQILREVEAGETTLSSVALSRSGRMLFGGTIKGTLWSLKFPLTIPGEWQELQGHGAQITKVRMKC